MKYLPWALFGLATAALVAVVANQGLTSQQVIDSLKNPLAVAVVVSIFAYLTIGRLKNMDDRIGKVEDRTIAFWQEALKEIKIVASDNAKSTIGEMQASLEIKVADVTKKLNETISNNPWLSEVSPDQLVLSVKHLEPIHKSASELIKSDRKKTEFVRKWIAESIKDPEIKGTPNDFHNLGVLASRDLNDDLLALLIYQKYLNQSPTPNADVISDALQVATRAELWSEADEIAGKIKNEIDSKNILYVNRWRPWVFLSEYFAAKGMFDESIETLKAAQNIISEPKEKAHASLNLALALERVGDVKQTEEIYHSISVEHPMHVPAGLAYARFLASNGRKQESLDVCEDYIARGCINREHDLYCERLKELKSDLNPGGEGGAIEHFNNGIKFVLSVANDELGEEATIQLVESVKKKMEES